MWSLGSRTFSKVSLRAFVLNCYGYESKSVAASGVVNKLLLMSDVSVKEHLAFRSILNHIKVVLIGLSLDKSQFFKTC